MHAPASAPDAPTAATDTTPWPAPAAAWGMVGLLFLAGVFSVVDRAILNMVVDPVRADLGISDARIGLLQGLAFGLFYACMGVPMGLLADRVQRRRLLMAGIGLWSIATIASGLAHSFGQIFAARLLVGLGEAALGPCAISLIADLFAPDRRGRPISLFMMGQSLAAGIAIWFTGRVLAMSAAGDFAGWPVLAGLAPWRTAFVLAGVLGLVVVAGFAMAREPARRQSGVTVAQPTLAECGAWFWQNRSVMLPLYLGFALVFVAAYGAASWQPAMLMRGFHQTPGFVAAWLAPTSMAFSAAGPLIGGWLVDRAARSGRVLSRHAILRVVPLLALPSALAVAVGDPRVAAVLVASGNAIYAVLGTVMLATLQAIVPPRMRGTAVALTLVFNTLIGASLGPLMVGAITDNVLGDPARVGLSIALVAVPALVLGAISYAMGAVAMARALTRESEPALLLKAASGA
ncbi:MFS transporter [Novosphingobium sp. FSY-8]|uniref:MFS transporter n=1 Tax=Novosphingobium ovatum TaxID=1908523 RepID=A0ABW9XBQ5_9SPHN|nr:MFS transporter [Novosphingobium ovatum]NBC35974.1 MFS transporter [Novosphingobium ovatum]